VLEKRVNPLITVFSVGSFRHLLMARVAGPVATRGRRNLGADGQRAIA